MTHLTSNRALGALAALLASLLLGVALVGPGTAHANQSCSPPAYPGSGYFTSLSVHRTSCATGRKVALAYYHCRVKHGKSGSCHHRVLGYSCKERRVTISTEYDSRVTCRRGGATVIHTYQQNT